MLTRIEIDGFKSFADFSLDIPPFLAIVGPNASGKSNLFDAIQLLGRLAGGTVDSALDGGRGQPEELFRRRSDGQSSETMRFAVEVLLEPFVVDQFGKTARLTQTRIRYEVQLRQWVDDDGIRRSYVTYESATPIAGSEDRWAIRHQVAGQFSSSHLFYGHRGPILETARSVDGSPVFYLQEGGPGSIRQVLPADAAQSTVLSSIPTAANFPSLFALRRELQSWRFFHLEPASLRVPSPKKRTEQLGATGENLALVLWRIEQRTGDSHGSLLDEIAVDLCRVVPGVMDVEVVEAPSRQHWEVYLRMQDEGRISARVASDGTLRVLALLTALHDPSGGGLICLEEPENGIYPQQLRDLLGQLRRLVVDPRDTSPEPRPLTQLLLTSHSPVLLRELPADQLVVFDLVTRVVPAAGELSRVTRVRHVRDEVSARNPLPIDEVGTVVSEAERAAMTGITRHHAEELLD